jgi:hypothetical protein
VPDMPDRIVAATAVYFRCARSQPRRPHSRLQCSDGMVNLSLHKASAPVCVR